MSKVKLQPTESGALFTASKNNPEYGYIQVRQSTLKSSVGRWAETEERSALILGTIPALRTIITEAKGGELPGKIVVWEWPQSEVPDQIHNEIMGKRTDEEAAYKRYFKRAGKDGIFLTKDGERIVRYAFWDKSGEVADIICTHDNGEAIRQARAAKAEKEAELPAAAPATRKRATLPA
jgi:hypothetical protein